MTNVFRGCPVRRFVLDEGKPQKQKLFESVDEHENHFDSNEIKTQNDKKPGKVLAQKKKKIEKLKRKRSFSFKREYKEIPFEGNDAKEFLKSLGNWSAKVNSKTQEGLF